MAREQSSFFEAFGVLFQGKGAKLLFRSIWNFISREREQSSFFRSIWSFISMEREQSSFFAAFGVFATPATAKFRKSLNEPVHKEAKTSKAKKKRCQRDLNP